ncbi:MAG: VOC family protein [Vicinamibacterales bacterium]|jgi:extradiol dioxygenase family protein|nr:VOC family protein [Vicinamibacterales bacterium]
MRLLLTAVALSLIVSPANAQLAVPNEAGLTYGHVHLNVTDVDLHTQIWVEHFGGVATQKGPLRAVRMAGTVIVFTEREPTGPSQGSVMDHFGVKVRDTGKWLEKWKAAGYTVDSEFTGAEGQHNAYVTLPDGVRVELQEDQMLPQEVVGYHVHFFTPEFESLLDWYVDVFGLEKRPRGRIETTTNVPGMNMSFGNTQGEYVPSQGRAIDHIGFELDDLEAFCEQLKAKGIEFDVEYREIDSIELKIAFLTDPAGTYIELTEGLDRY